MADRREMAWCEWCRWYQAQSKACANMELVHARIERHAEVAERQLRVEDAQRFLVMVHCGHCKGFEPDERTIVLRDQGERLPVWLDELRELERQQDEVYERLLGGRELWELTSEEMSEVLSVMSAMRNQ